MSPLVVSVSRLARPDRDARGAAEGAVRLAAPHRDGELLTKRRPIDFGRVATCLCRPV